MLLEANEIIHFYETGGSSNCTSISPTDFSMPHHTISSMTLGATKSYCGTNNVVEMIHFLKGELDELRFYNRKLNQVEIDSLYNQTHTNETITICEGEQYEGYL